MPCNVDSMQWGATKLIILKERRISLQELPSPYRKDRWYHNQVNTRRKNAGRILLSPMPEITREMTRQY